MPDLNSVPESPRVLALSRRTSAQQMPPPPAPAPASGSPPSDPALNILPSNLNAVTTGAPSIPSLPSPRLPPTGAPAQPPPDASAGPSGPGPLRHPRPLTAAELHQQLEKEQEAVVRPVQFCYGWTTQVKVLTMSSGQPTHARARPASPSSKCLCRIQRLVYLRRRLRLGC